MNLYDFPFYSNERLDMIEQREQFLKNTFESLGGSENDFQQQNHHFPSMLKINIIHLFDISFIFNLNPYSR